MFARIYRPAKSAMQSGQGKAKAWLLEFDAETARQLDPLMGWTSAADMAEGQVRLYFDTEAEAKAFAERRGFAYRIDPEHEPALKPKAYADNFAYRRRKPWTH